MNVDQEELAVIAKNTPAIKPFLQKFSEYLKGEIQVRDDMWTSYADQIETLQKLAGEKDGYQTIVDFLESLIRPEKDNGEKEE